MTGPSAGLSVNLVKQSGTVQHSLMFCAQVILINLHRNKKQDNEQK